MEKRIGFEDAVDEILTREPRYHRDAYLFLRDSLDHTVKELGRETRGVGSQHVSGPELLEGFRTYSLNQFGPMVLTVFDEWGLFSCHDIGNIVFSMIDIGVFGKSPSDRRQDFDEAYGFEEAFVIPFLPRHSSDPSQPEGDLAPR